MRYVYLKTNGIAHDVRYVAEDYVLSSGELEGRGEPLPTAAQLSDPQPPAPDVPGFITDLKAAMGGIVASNGLAKAYPLFYPALQQGVFADAQALIIDAHATLVLNDTQYAAFKALAAKHGLPVTLP